LIPLKSKANYKQLREKYMHASARGMSQSKSSFENDVFEYGLINGKIHNQYHKNLDTEHTTRSH
jgi:hypothetical protein